jgi:hypothetical protein
MYKPSTYVIITYFPTYLPRRETYFLQTWLPRWNQILTQLRFIHNWVINGHLVDGALFGCNHVQPFHLPYCIFDVTKKPKSASLSLHNFPTKSNLLNFREIIAFKKLKKFF